MNKCFASFIFNILTVSIFILYKINNWLYPYNPRRQPCVVCKKKTIYFAHQNIQTGDLYCYNCVKFV